MYGREFAKLWNSKIILKSKKELSIMRDSNLIVAEVLNEIERAAQPGVTTWKLNKIAENIAKKYGARPAFKGYMGFPYSLCVSLNEVVVHGRPSKNRYLTEGDVLSVDFGVEYKGFFGDAARTIPIGQVSKEAKRLIETTSRALEKGIDKCIIGNRIYDISSTIQDFVESNGYHVVYDYVGHGIGRKLHEAPAVPNFKEGSPKIKLEPGLVITIEPMVNIGTSKVKLLDDKWTSISEDRSLSAHFEHSVAITENGPYILSKP
jgi:methionyl aminopeptidase